MTTTIKRTWAEEGVMHEQDISPEEFYSEILQTMRSRGLTFDDDKAQALYASLLKVTSS